MQEKECFLRLCILGGHKQTHSGCVAWGAEEHDAGHTHTHTHSHTQCFTSRCRKMILNEAGHSAAEPAPRQPQRAWAPMNQAKHAKGV